MWLFVKLGSWCYRTNVYVAGVMSLQPRCYEADVMVQVVQSHFVCERCYVTPSLDVMACYLSLSSGELENNRSDLYLQWDSHHNPAAKYNVINTLTHRAKSA